MQQGTAWRTLKWSWNSKLKVNMLCIAHFGLIKCADPGGNKWSVSGARRRGFRRGNGAESGASRMPWALSAFFAAHGAQAYMLCSTRIIMILTMQLDHSLINFSYAYRYPGDVISWWCCRCSVLLVGFTYAHCRSHQSPYSDHGRRQIWFAAHSEQTDEDELASERTNERQVIYWYRLHTEWTI